MNDIKQTIQSLEVGVFPTVPVKIDYDVASKMNLNLKGMLIHSPSESVYIVPTQEIHFLNLLNTRLHGSSTFRFAIKDLENSFNKTVIPAELSSTRDHWVIPVVNKNPTTKIVSLAKTTKIENRSTLTSKEVPVSDCIVELELSSVDTRYLSNALDTDDKGRMNEVLAKYFAIANQEITKNVDFNPCYPLFGKFWLSTDPNNTGYSVLQSYDPVTDSMNLIIRFHSRCTQDK